MNEAIQNRVLSSKRRPRIVLVAYHCALYCGSEFVVGWNCAVQGGRFADCWVICEAESCEDSVRQFTALHGPVKGVNFEFVPYSQLENKLRRIPGCKYLAYQLWHRRVFKRATLAFSVLL